MARARLFRMADHAEGREVGPRVVGRVGVAMVGVKQVADAWVGKANPTANTGPVRSLLAGLRNGTPIPWVGALARFSLLGLRGLWCEGFRRRVLVVGGRAKEQL